MASGYDLTDNHTYRLLKGRLGIFDKHSFEPSKVDPSLKNLKVGATRLRTNGGYRQQDRMIRDKRKALDRAVHFSYQGADIIRIDAEIDKPVKALINPNKLKQDYDDKIISIGFEHNFAPGMVFEWVNTNTKWLVYLQDLTELAYFRGDIRKCSYEIELEDGSKTYAAIRGPVETKIDYIQKHGISVDNPNHSLNILLPKNETTLKYFKRYSKFYLKEDTSICWRVEATDAISMPGILEVNAVEYYVNEFEDDTDQGIVGGLIEEIKDPNPLPQNIQGDTFIKPKKEYIYSIETKEKANWVYDTNLPLKVILLEEDIPSIKIKWTSSYSGQFDLSYGDQIKTIVVESLF